MQKFRDLSKAEKLELMGAWLDGKEIEWHCEGIWYVDEPLWVSGTVYRIKPEPTTLDSLLWQYIAPEYKYCARNANGTVYMFTTKPIWIASSQGWASSGGEAVAVNYGSNAAFIGLYTSGNVAAEDSLIVRPEGV